MKIIYLSLKSLLISLCLQLIYGDSKSLKPRISIRISRKSYKRTDIVLGSTEPEDFSAIINLVRLL
jgi:hypothetical protein